MRVVLDVNVYVSALISQSVPGRDILTAWTEHQLELIISPILLGELRDVLVRPKFRRWVSSATAEDLIAGLAADAGTQPDPPAQLGLTEDPDDDYLVSLARAAHADYLISGDRHLLQLTDPDPPVITPRQLLDRLT